MWAPDQDQYYDTVKPKQIIEREDDGTYYYNSATAQRVRPTHNANSNQGNTRSTTPQTTMWQQQYLQENMCQPDQRGMSPHYNRSFQQQQRMEFQQPTNWGSNQRQFMGSSSNHYASSSSAPHQNSYSRARGK